MHLRLSDFGHVADAAELIAHFGAGAGLGSGDPRQPQPQHRQPPAPLSPASGKVAD